MELPEGLQPEPIIADSKGLEANPLSIETRTLAEVEKDVILERMELIPNKVEAAKSLGISVKTLYNKLEEYGFHIPKAKRRYVL